MHAVLVSLLITAVMADPSELPDVPDHTATPDRPDFANGVFTVARGGWQLELGGNLDLSRRSPSRLPLGLPTAIRIGITDRLELRAFDAETAEWIGPGGEVDPREGFGAKLRLVDEQPRRWIPGIGLQPMAYVGLRRDVLPAGEFTFIVSQPFGRSTTLDLNFGGELELVRRGAPQRGGLFAASLGVQAHPRLLAFGEFYVSGSQRPQTRRLGGDAGVVVSLTARFAFDVAARVEDYGGRRAITALAGITALVVAPCHHSTQKTTRRWLCRSDPPRAPARRARRDATADPGRPSARR